VLSTLRSLDDNAINMELSRSMQRFQLPMPCGTDTQKSTYRLWLAMQIYDVLRHAASYMVPYTMISQKSTYETKME
jgi:hypothetical protein